MILLLAISLLASIAFLSVVKVIGHVSPSVLVFEAFLVYIRCWIRALRIVSTCFGIGFGRFLLRGALLLLGITVLIYSIICLVRVVQACTTHVWVLWLMRS